MEKHWKYIIRCLQLFQFLGWHKTYISPESVCCLYIRSFPRNSATILVSSNLRSDLLDLSMRVYIQVNGQTHSFLRQIPYILQNLSALQLKWINASVPDIIKVVKIIQHTKTTRRNSSLPDLLRPLLPEILSIQLPRQNYPITQPNPNKQSLYLRRPPHRQSTRTQPQFDENGVPRCNYCKQWDHMKHDCPVKQ